MSANYTLRITQKTVTLTVIRTLSKRERQFIASALSHCQALAYLCEREGQLSIVHTGKQDRFKQRARKIEKIAPGKTYKAKREFWETRQERADKARGSAVETVSLDALTGWVG